MVALITNHTQVPKPHCPFSRLKCPLISSLVVPNYPRKRPQNFKKASIFIRSLGFAKVSRKFEGYLGVSLCKQIDEDTELEAQILEFMDKSERPTMFPTKKELIRAGRMDLVNAIMKKGGWYSLGWDEGNVGGNLEEDFDIREFQLRVERGGESASLRDDYSNNFSGRDKDNGSFNVVETNCENSENLELASSSPFRRSLGNGMSEGSGIEGILSRLEKQRSSDLGVNLAKYGRETHTGSKDRDETEFDTCTDVVRDDVGDKSKLTHDLYQSSTPNSLSGNIGLNTGSENWRTWSNRRAGFQHTEFEAAEISFIKNPVDRSEEAQHGEMFAAAEENAEARYGHEQINHNHIRTRLQHLELELNSTLQSLRSKRNEAVSEDNGSLLSVSGSSSRLNELSDAWEFQENEFMSAKERLRSIKAKLAVLEGKMALAIIDAHKIAEEKQKRIDGARKALQLLRTTFIVWPNSASEVLLAGSFDGWTTKRKMEKSKTGIFSICLKLYPGRYEIKFIVDGVWKVDPLRPIVNYSGHENNLLIVT